MKAFLYENKEFIRVIPVKKLFNSTMIHEVVNRGDIFAVNLSTQELTVIPGKAAPQFIDVEIVESSYFARLKNQLGEL